MTLPAEIFPYLILSAALVLAVPGTRVKSILAAVAIGIGAIYAAIVGVGTIVGSTMTVEGGLIAGLDPVGGVFLLAIAINGVACSVYAIGYVAGHAAGKSQTQVGLHFASLVVLFYAMIGVVCASDTYTFLFWWELMTLSSFVLVMFDGQRKEVLHAAVGYLILMHVGFFFLLGGFVMPAGGEAFFGSGGMGLPVFLLFFVGFGLKAGLFPLHMWLPVAHPAAPSHVSAMMSGVMIKMGIYGLLRAVLALTPEALFTAGLLLFAVGAVTAIFGIARAAVQTDLKRLLAYSSIENIGIICLGIGFGALGRAAGSDFIAYAGFGGALLHVLGHSNYKTMLFLGAGSVVAATRNGDMNRLGGLLQRMPLTGALFLVATLAICAVPALVGFTSEFVLFSGFFGTVTRGELVAISIVGIVALALVGGLTLMTFAKAFGITFLGNPRGCAAREAREVGGVMLVAQVLPLAGILAGPVLYPYLVLEYADVLFGARYYAQPMIDTLLTVEVVGAIVLVFTIGLVVLKWQLNRRFGVGTVRRPTWGCAFTVPNKHMQYTASSFNRELQTGLADRGADREVREFGEEEIFPGPLEFKKEERDTTARVATRWIARQLHCWTARLALFQTGKTNHYVLHALVLLVLILVLTLFGVL